MGVSFEYNVYSPGAEDQGDTYGGYRPKTLEKTKKKAIREREKYIKKNTKKKGAARLRVLQNVNEFNEIIDNIDFYIKRRESYRWTVNRMREIVRKNARLLDEAYNQNTGSLTMRPRGKKTQIYNLTVNNALDALVAMNILTNERPREPPPSYFKAYQIFEENYPLEDDYIVRFIPELAPYMQIPTPETRRQKSTVITPKTWQKKRPGRIQYGGAAYKRHFMGMRLKKVIYKSPEHFNIKDYTVNGFCVPSYLKSILPKKAFKQIEDNINEDKRPTYPALEKILNKIEYGLNVYIVDGERIHETTQPNKLNIMISDGHLYALNKRNQNENSIFKKTTKKEIGIKQFIEMAENINVSYRLSNEIIKDNVRYVLANRFKDINTIYAFSSTFSDINIDFFDNCFIRASRYINTNYKYSGGIDINKCYLNIFGNPNYKFPVQTGHEKTEKYNNKKIIEYGFYYCSFNNFTEVDRAIFNTRNCWIMGYLIINLKLDVNITYEHITPMFETGKRTPYHDNLDNKDNKILLTHYSGTLAKYKTDTERIYNTDDEHEKLGLLEKYKKIAGEISGGVSVNYIKYKKSSGFYAYLGILSYAKYQLYRIYQEMNKKYGCNIQKIYTDSIAFDICIDKETEHVKYLNDVLKSEHIQVKAEFKPSTFENVQHTVDHGYTENTIKEYEKEDITELLKNNKSFFMNGKAGYGKTYELTNTIIKYFKDNNINFLVTSATIENAKQINGIHIQSKFGIKETSFIKIVEEMEQYKYIIVDESSQLTIDIINYLSFLKKRLGTNIILIGDSNQCRAVDTHKTWLTSEAFYKVIDYNVVLFKWHKFARYTKEYDTFLNTLLDMFDKSTRYKINEYIKTYFNIKKESEDQNIIKIVWTHKKGADINKYATVHVMQGKTITADYSIYEWDRMPKEVLYTALSRASDPKYITLCI